MIIGHGIDILEINRVRRLISMPNSQWLEAAFSQLERNCADAPPNNFRYFAGRFTAKEAVAKALGTGISGEIAWVDIEILKAESGAPYVVLGGEAKRLAEEMGIKRWFVSISHNESLAMASAIAVGG